MGGGKGQDPLQFGNNAWSFLHLTSLAFDVLVAALKTRGMAPPNELRRAMADFMQVFTRVLQCLYCRRDGTEINRRLESDQPIARAVLAGRTFERSVHVHNQVNTKLGRESMSVEDARVRWARSWTDASVEGVFWQYLLRLVLHYDDNGEIHKNMFYERLFTAAPYLYALVVSPPSFVTDPARPVSDESDIIHTHTADAADAARAFFAAIAPPTSATLYETLLCNRFARILPRVHEGIDAAPYDVNALRDRLGLDAPPGVRVPAARAVSPVREETELRSAVHAARTALAAKAAALGRL